MITKVECIIVECDNCKEHYEESQTGFSIFADENAGLEKASEDEWYFEHENGKATGIHFCDKCYHFDDNDEFVLNSLRTKSV